MPRKDPAGNTRYRQDHRKELAAAARIYYHDHRDECRERMRRYHREHRDELLDRAKNYYRNHREEKLAHQRCYQQEHREQCAAYRAGLPLCYRSWLHMRNRCENPRNRAYARYGGRGIVVCERWNSFDAFLEDMGDRPKGYDLHRINNDGNYEKANCVWVSKSEHRKIALKEAS